MTLMTAWFRFPSDSVKLQGGRLERSPRVSSIPLSVVEWGRVSPLRMPGDLLNSVPRLGNSARRELSDQRRFGDLVMGGHLAAAGFIDSS